MAVGEADLQEATHVLNMYFPADAEREWLLRFFGRCLAPHDCCKVLVCMTDSLGDDDMPGNAAKTTLLNWLQSVLGSCNCSMQSGQALTLGHSASSTHASEPQHISAPLLRCFDEVSHTNSTACAHQLNYGQLKYLTAGRNTQPAVLIAANVHDWPNLTNLQERDPALTSRLVMLPARGRFNQTPGQGTVNIQEKLYALAPAFARLLVDAFAAYKTSGNQLLPFPSSMILFKQLVIHSSALHTFCTSDVAATRDWLQQHTCSDASRKLPFATLLQLFTCHWLSSHTDPDRRKQCKSASSSSQLLQQLLDGVLATRGILRDGNDCVGLWLRGLPS
jgi:hypothetical protein